MEVNPVNLDEETEQHSHTSNSSEMKNRLASAESAQEPLQVNGKTDSKEENSKTFIRLKNVPCVNQENESNTNSSPISNLPIINVETTPQVKTNNLLPCQLYRRIEKHVDILLNPEEIPVYEFYDEDEEKKKIEQRKKDRELREIKNRTCIHCRKIFPDAMDVLRHKRVAHPTKRIILQREEIQRYMAVEDRKQCPVCFIKICPKGYKSKYVKHLLTHCIDYKFVCRVCGMKFRRCNHQKDHESRHIVPPEKVE
ncbi:zinc finger protein 674 [Dendroctonus ponderosae]|uniref:zinc finger protein 674 n=1 Tax=Dendroctonus ponderosae TaxID=77166 RepID=UPI00203552A2|nr:zinc finger protein 674 [Dendroctonus ponderosae]XP_019769879.2 zinc finger protein 674 [Dendroctonus ponderosae]XP_019769881.2 zinc finger protein 674 [Dendroctonus ponderosae]KAH1018879.1 hypothetical protein HUJ05_006564 [Dendroctonus ponderosae]